MKIYLSILLLLLKGLVASGQMPTVSRPTANCQPGDPKPQASFMSANNVCSGDSVQFNSSVTGGTAPYTYIWKFGGGGTSNQEDPFHTFTSLGCGTVSLIDSLIVIDANGCADTSAAPITIKQAPDVQLQDTDVFSPFSNCDNFPSPASPIFNLTVRNISPSAGCINTYSIDWGDGTVPQSGLVASNFPVTHTYNTLGIFNLKVTAFGSNGCVGSKTYEVVNRADPAVGISGPEGTTGCAPISFWFKLKDFQSNSPGTFYVWNFGDGTPPVYWYPPITVDSIQHPFNETSCGQPNNEFIVKVTALNGCEPKSATVDRVKIYKRPRANFTTELNGCTNQQHCFTDSSEVGYYGATCSTNTTYNWDFGDPSSGPNNFSTLQSPCHQYANPGIYTVILTTSNPCGSSTDSMQICITAPPIPSFTVDTTAICTSGIVAVTNTSVPGTCSNVNYQWTVTYSSGYCGTDSSWAYTNNTNAASINPSFVFNSPGIYTIRLLITGPCPTTGPVEKVIKVKSTPAAILQNIPLTTCSQASICPTATVQNCADTALAYLWMLNGQPFGNAQDSIPGCFTINGNNTHIVSLSVSNECGSDIDSASIVITPPPVANAGPDKEVCSGEPVSIGSPAITGLTYQWTPANGLNDAAIAMPTLTLVYNGPSADTLICYALTVSAGANCRGFDTVCVRVKKRPDVTVTAVPAVICAGDSVVLTAAGASTYSWSPGTGLSATTGNPVIARPTANSTYQVIGTENGCTDTAQVAITVTDYVVVDAGPDTTICNNNTAVQLVGSPANGTWSGNHISITGIFNVQAAGNGLDTVYYTYGNNNCNRTDTAIITVIDSTIAFAGNDTTICQSANGLTLVGLPPGGTWSGSTQVSGTGQLNTSVAGIYILTYTVGSGSCIARDSVVVNVGAGVTGNTIDPDRDICIGLPTGIINGSLPQGGGGGYTYQWEQSSNGSNPWTPILGANSQSYDPGTINQSTCYRRTVTTQTCGNALASPSNPICITIRPNAQANFTASDTLLCAGVLLDTVITVTPFSGNSTYAWFADGVALAPASTNSAFPGFTIAAANDTIVIRLDVASAFGCQPDSKSIRFITRPNVVPSFSIGNTADSCGPRAVTITNTSSILDTTVRFTWDFGNGQTSISTQPGTILFAANPLPRDTTYYITLRADNRCTVVTYRDSVVVKSKPRAGFTPSRTVGCSPFRDTLVNGSSLNSDRFLWDYGNGVNFITTKRDTFLVANYNTAIIDTFRIRLIAENGCGRDTAFVDVVVSPNTIQAAITVSGPSQEICAPGVATFLNASIGAAYLKWDYGDGSPIDSTNNIPGNYFHTYTNPGTYLLTVRLVNSCTDTSITRTVVVYPKPKAQFSVIPAVPICTGDSIVTNNSSTGANAYEWIWGDGSPNSNAFNATHVFTQAGTYTVRLIAKKIGLLGLLCTDTAATTVQVIARIPAQIVLINISPLCAPNAVLSLAAPGTAAAASVQWVIYDTAQPGGQVILNGSAVAYPIQQAGNYLVKLYVTNSANCTDSASIIFTVFPRPKLSFVADTLRTCNRDTTIRFVATTTYAGPGTVAVTWLINGVVSGSGNPYFHRFTIPAGNNQAVNFTVQAVATAVTGCTDTTATSIFTVLPTPRPKIIVSPTTVIRQPDNNFTFTDTNAVNVNYDWQWSMGDQINRSGNPITHEYGNTGSYSVKLRLTDFLTGCSGRDSVRVTIEPVPGYLFVPNAFYPNSLKMELRKFLPKGRGLKRYQLQIYDGLGKLIFETTALDADGRPSQGWDGTFRGQAMPQDAYLWVIRVADFKNGTEWNGMKYSGDNKPHSSGSVTLFR